MSTALRWVRADARDVVEVVQRRRSRRALPASSTFAKQLDRWRARIARQRAIVVVRRHLLVLVALVVVAEIVVLATGNGHRPAWLIAPLLLALVDGAVAMARSVSADRAAQMLDADLGLHARVGTALELQAATSAPHGLGALVVDEANTALAGSLGSARASARGSRVEWGWLLAAIAALAVVALVSWGSSTSPVSHGGAAAGLAGSRGGAPAGNSSGSRGAAGSRHGRSLSHAPKLPRGRSLQAGLVNNGSHAAPDNGSSLYGGGHLTAGQLAAMRREGLAAAGATGGASGSTALAGAGAPGGGNSAAHGPSEAGAQALGKPQPGLGGGGLSAAKSASASGAGAGGASAPSGGGGRSGSAASGISPSAAGGYNRGSGGAPSGGDTAGGSRAASDSGPSLVPELQGRSRLPLQASYSPVGSKGSSRSGGTSETANGGGGRSRTAQAGVGAPSTSTANLALIPPTSNATSAPALGLLQGYFGTSDQLTFSTW